MSSELQREQIFFQESYSKWLFDYYNAQIYRPDAILALLESVNYSLQLPGKRFRPFLSYLIWKSFKKSGLDSVDRLKNWCLAIEFIHTYSLIHDDLPCMDNDDFRRGKPANHKVFGDDIALLAGDALLTEAFHLISNDEKLTAETRIKLIILLSEKIGLRGMVAGQVLDMKSTNSITEDQLKKIHELKTGYLIEAAALGGAIIAEVNEIELQFISHYAKSLGLAFQIKDDLMDANEKEQDFKSYVSIHGLEKTKELLKQVSNQALQALKRNNDQNLIDLIQQNIQRET